MKVKMINKVPLAGKDGSVYHPAPGSVEDVPESVAAALLRGGDAEAVVEAKVEAKAPEAPAEKPVALKKKGVRKTKNRGAAPENK